MNLLIQKLLKVFAAIFIVAGFISCSGQNAVDTDTRGYSIQTVEIHIVSNEMIDAEEFLYLGKTYKISDSKMLFESLNIDYSNSSLIIRVFKDAAVDSIMVIKTGFQSLGFQHIRVGILSEKAKD